MIRAVARWNPLAVLLVASIAACFSRPDAPVRGTGDAGGPDDDASMTMDGMPGDGGGSGTDAAPASCLTDNFNAGAGSGCPGWATYVGGGGSGQVSRDGVQLVMGVSSTGIDVTASCVSKVAYPFTSGFEVRLPGGGPSAGQQAILADTGGIRVGAAVDSSGNVLVLGLGGGVTYTTLTPTSPFVLGVRPGSSPGEFYVYTRDSDITMTNGPFTTDTSVGQADAKLVLEIQMSTMGTAKFDDVTSCGP